MLLLQPFVLPSPACPLTWVPPHGTQTLPSVQPSQPYMESISQFTMEASTPGPRWRVLMATREPDLHPAGPRRRRGDTQSHGTGGGAGTGTQCLPMLKCRLFAGVGSSAVPRLHTPPRASASYTAALQILTLLPAADTGSASGPAGVRLTLVLALTVLLELT